MKALVCELCGGNEFVKDGDFFVCQNCGIKYSTDDAKKMMVEGIVKIDNSDKLRNYYKLARTAKDEDDSTNAKKYYELILEEEPLSWEAKFYSNYYAAMECKVAEAFSMCEKIKKIIPSVLDLLRESIDSDQTKAIVEELSKKLHDLSSIFLIGNSELAAVEAIDLLIQIADNIERVFPEYASEFAKGFWESAVAAMIDRYGTGNENTDQKIEANVEKIQKYDPDYRQPKSRLTKHSPDSPNKVAAKVLKLGHHTYEAGVLGVQEVFKAGCDEVGHIGAEVIFKNIEGNTIKYVSVHVTPYNAVGDVVSCTVTQTTTFGIRFTGPIPVGEKVSGFVDGIWYNNSITSAKIDYVDVTYQDDSIERFDVSDLSEDTQVSSATSQSGGCYVATCVYGSYDCPEVWTLRRYRDYTLAETWYGRAFIHTYYAISPTLVKCFGKTKWFKNIFKPKLDKMVAKLNASGVEDTPYNDRNW